MLFIIFLTIILSIVASVYTPFWLGFFVLIFAFILFLYRRKDYKFFFFLALLFFVFFVYTSLIIETRKAEYNYINQHKGSVRLQGKVVSIYNYGFLYKVIDDEHLVNKKILVFKKNHEFIPGDIVKVDGEILIDKEEIITKLELLTKPVASILSRQVIKVQDSKLTWIFKVKSLFITNVKKHIPEYYANFLIGLLIGTNGIELDSQLQDTFLNLGLLHMLVVSGAQVALLTSILLKFLVLFNLPKATNFIIVLIFNSIFLVFVGGDISVLRAVIMMQITIFLNYDNRSKTSLQVLALTGILMLAFSPSMMFSLGFILSFCATFAVVEISPRLQKMLEDNDFLPEFIKEPLGVSLGPILVTSPIIFLINRRFDVLALFANMLFGPIVEVVVIIGFLGMLLSICIPFLAIPVLNFTFGLMVVMKMVADIFYVFPWRSVYFRNAFSFNVVAYYIFFFSWLYKREWLSKYWQNWLTLLCAVVIANFWFMSKMPEKELFFYNTKDWFSVLYVNRDNSFLIVSEENLEEEKKFMKNTIQVNPTVRVDIKAKVDNEYSMSMNNYNSIALNDIFFSKIKGGFKLEDKDLELNIFVSSNLKEPYKGIVYLPFANRINQRNISGEADIIIYGGKDSNGNIIANKRNLLGLYQKDNKYHLYQQK